MITYLLGIGDRHLDNLLLSKDGKLIHIDFGYILGNDPKLFPPPMKLCPEMVMCMGGVDSPEARKFRSLCYLAFNTLRKSANLILNLFSLMVHSNVSDIRADPDKAVLKVRVRGAGGNGRGGWRAESLSSGPRVSPLGECRNVLRWCTHHRCKKTFS